MSFPSYEQYKESGAIWLGLVPVGWKVAPLKAVARVINGFPFDAKLFDPAEGIPLVRIRDLNQSVPDARYKGEFVDVASIDNDDVLIGMDGDFNVGRWLGEVPALLNQRMCCVRAHSPFVTRYLEYVLPTPLKAINEITYSTTVKHLSSFDVLKVSVAMPSSESEIGGVVAFLDRETAKIDALVEEQRRLIELLKEKRQAVIAQAVTKGLNPSVPMKESGNQWIGTVPEHWTLMRLKHAKSRVKNAFVDGPFGSNLKSEHFIEDGDVYVIESGFATQGRLNLDDLKTISAEHFATIDRSETRGGDIIIAKIGAQYGKSSILPELNKPAVVSGNSLKLTVDAEAFDVNFVNWQLANLKALGAIEDIVNATAQPALSLGEMSNLPLVAPPKEEQQAIVGFLVVGLGELDGLMAEAQRGIDLLQERRAALISAAVTGKIDVRGLVPQPEAVAA